MQQHIGMEGEEKAQSDAEGQADDGGHEQAELVLHFLERFLGQNC